MNLIQEIHQKAGTLKKHIVLPESEDDRVLQAASQLVETRICDVSLIGNQESVNARAGKMGLSLKDVQCIDPMQFTGFQEYAHTLYELRKHKGLDLSGAEKLIADPLYFGAMMVRMGNADGSVAGAMHVTGDVLRAAIHCIGLKPGIKVVSSIFLMIIPNWPEVLTFADAGVVPDPDPEELASIAICSAHTHELLTGNNPSVALLSFSTHGSASHARVDKVREAAQIVRKREPGLNSDGELQADAALVPEVCQKKSPDSPLAGKANVLVFPDLNSANIAYKLTQRLANATALGPLIQGLKKPAMDLSRGCSVQDIVDVSAICAILSMN